MKTSELIKTLQGSLDTNGDLPVSFEMTVTFAGDTICVTPEDDLHFSVTKYDYQDGRGEQTELTIKDF